MKNWLTITSITLGLGLISCSPGDYVRATPDAKAKPSATPKPDESKNSLGKNNPSGEGPLQGLQALECGDEQRTVAKRLSVTVNPSEQVFPLHTICKTGVETESRSSKQFPTDIIFALDITGSMQPNINAILDNVVTFARSIESKGWEARFGAVGFRDKVDAVHILSDANGLVEALKRFSATAGGDSQEFSQGGVMRALAMFEEDKNANPERLRADKVVVLVTDNPGWNPSTADRNDFDTFGLEKTISDASAVFPRLRFFHSTSSVILPAARLSANGQFNAVLTRTGIYGKALAYPLTQDVILNQFVEEFKPVKETREMSCRLVSVSVKDLQGVTRTEAFTFQDGKEMQEVKITKNLIQSNQLAQAVGERCCNPPGAADSACTQRVSFMIPLRIK